MGFEWTGNSSTSTGGQPDPNGGNEALQVAIPAGGGGSRNNVSQFIAGLTSGITYTRSAWCKGVVGQQIYFDSNSTASQVLVTFTGAWQRVFTSSAPGTGCFVSFECYNRSGGAHLPAVTFQCWGAQLNLGTVPTAYLPTTTAARVGLALD